MVTPSGKSLFPAGTSRAVFEIPFVNPDAQISKIRLTRYFRCLHSNSGAVVRLNGIEQS